MSYPYNYDIQFGSEHSFADSVIVPDVTPESNGGNNQDDDQNDDNP